MCLCAAAGVAGAALGARTARRLLPPSAMARRRLAALLGAAAAPAGAIGLLFLLGKQHTPLLRRRMPQGGLRWLHQTLMVGSYQHLFAYPCSVSASAALPCWLMPYPAGD